ncbi:Rcs stress response system protein RcsF [Shewanella glacialipiscicola]|uniref:Rcs stress response system protein RcsF n=1 Tax=Shewanella glacialipiscicola TaxID=614069 RepID=UPI003D7B6E42
MKIILSSALVLLLSACASDYSFNSNLDGEAINDYFKASDVVLYEGDALPKGHYELKGLVQGESCQADLNGAPASLADARTEARRNAADKGANGIIIKQCVIFEEAAQGCISRALCVGQAIKTATIK